MQYIPPINYPPQVGVAYCLAILKQTRRNDALHWVDTVRHKAKADARALQLQQQERAAKEARAKERKEREERKKSSIASFFTAKVGCVERVEDGRIWEGGTSNRYLRSFARLVITMSGPALT